MTNAMLLWVSSHSTIADHQVPVRLVLITVYNPKIYDGISIKTWGYLLHLRLIHGTTEKEITLMHCIVWHALRWSVFMLFCVFIWDAKKKKNSANLSRLSECCLFIFVLWTIAKCCAKNVNPARLCQTRIEQVDG